MELLYHIRIDQFMRASQIVTEVITDSLLSPMILEEAAANGHLANIQWINDHSSNAFAPRAMNRAAANGH